MKIGFERKDLENEIYKSLYEINSTREDKERVISKIIARGFLPGDSQQIVSGNIALDFLHEIDLGVIGEAIYKVTDNVLVDPTNYYDEMELKQINDFKMELIEEDIKYPIVFKGMQRKSHDIWVGLITPQRFVKLHQFGASTYNFKTQRNPEHVKHGNITIKRANINPVSVREMTEDMVSNNYIYDEVTLNILTDGNEDFTFKEYKGFKDVGDIVLNKGSLNLTDGAHREKAAESALLINSNLQGNFTLVLTNFDVDKANQYIKQKDKRNPIDKEYLESKDMENLNNDIVRRLNENSESELKGLIVTDDFLLREGFGVVLFNTMSKTIETLWNIKIRKEINDISDYLIEFFNELVSIFPEELKFNIKENRNKNYINHSNMFIYYLTIAKEIQEKANWKELLYKIVNNTDFNKDNKYWKGTITYIRFSNLDKEIPNIIKQHQTKIRGDINEK